MKMKTIINTLLITGLLISYSCTKLDLDPLSEASVNTWYQENDQFEMSVNDLYQRQFWLPDAPTWQDDMVNRSNLTPITNATINSDWS